MATRKRKRGRPKSVNPKTPAERMRAYRKRKRDAGFRTVQRWEPADDTGPGTYSDHRILDARSLAMHCRIAKKIGQDPELLDKARDNLERWIRKSERPVPAYLLEWQEILARPWPEIAGVITAMNEESTRLRSSSPFAGILTSEEREQVYAAFGP
jgi:hypothetical protein